MISGASGRRPATSLRVAEAWGSEATGRGMGIGLGIAGLHTG